MSDVNLLPKTREPTEADWRKIVQGTTAGISNLWAMNIVNSATVLAECERLLRDTEAKGFTLTPELAGMVQGLKSAALAAIAKEQDVTPAA